MPTVMRKLIYSMTVSLDGYMLQETFLYLL